MKKSTIKVSRAIKNLIETIKQIEYGEISNIVASNENKEVGLTIEEPFVKLAGLFDQYNKVDTIMIHQGYPTYAIINMEVNGLTCIKRFKLMA